MIYLFTALYCEANIFIRQFHLEKDSENTWFQEFYSETADIRLTITGAGEIAASAAVGSICTRYSPKAEDVLLNIGTCAQRKGNAGIFVCNKIIEQATGKTFYPDILYKHDFQEKTIVTGMLPWNVGKDSIEMPSVISGENLYDMEAAAVYQAGSYFFGPHQMVFLKIVSDEGTAEKVSEKLIEHLMESCQDMLFSFVKQLSLTADKNMRKESCFREKEYLMAEKLSADMHCSKVMKDLLKQYIRYFTLSGVDYASVIQNMYQEGLLPCKDKREGKLRFEELKRRLL